MADVSAHGEIDRFGVEALGGGAAPDAVAVLATGVLGDGALAPGGAGWVAPPYLLGEALDVALVGDGGLLGA